MVKILTKNKRPDVLMIVVSCSISKKTFEHVNKELAKNGINEWIVWTDSVLEAMLYSEYPDLLSVYFGVIVDFKVKSKIELIEKRKRIRDDLSANILKPFDSSKPLFGSHTFDYRKLLVRSIFDEDDERTQDVFGWYSSFAVYPYSIGDFGLEVDIDWKRKYINEKGEIFDVQKDNSFQEIIFHKRAHLPYKNIYTYDLNSEFGRPVVYFGSNYASHYGRPMPRNCLNLGRKTVETMPLFG